MQSLFQVALITAALIQRNVFSFWHKRNQPICAYAPSGVTSTSRVEKQDWALGPGNNALSLPRWAKLLVRLQHTPGGTPWTPWACTVVACGHSMLATSNFFFFFWRLSNDLRTGVKELCWNFWQVATSLGWNFNHQNCTYKTRLCKTDTQPCFSSKVWEMAGGRDA